MPVSTPPADLAVTAFKALVAWRAVDRLVEPDDPRSWAALLQLRDLADRLDAYTAHGPVSALSEAIHDRITRPVR